MPSAPYHSNENAAVAANDSLTVATGEGSGFFTQFFATVRRQWIQKRRMPCSTCLEIFLPVVFILGLVLASKAASTETHEGEQFVPANVNGVPQAEAFNAMIQLAVCYNGSDVRLQNVFIDCATVQQPSAFTAPDAVKSDGRVPQGFYFNTNQGELIVALLASDFEFPWDIIAFDNYVALQWLVRSHYGPNDKTFSGGSKIMLQSSGNVIVVPRNPTTEAMVGYFNASVATWPYIFGGYAASRDEVSQRVVTVAGEGKTWAAVQVDEMSATKFQVEIGLNQSNTPSTLNVRQRFSGGLGSQPYGDYFVGGFITLEILIESYYLTQVLGLPQATVAQYNSNLLAVPMPFGKYRNSAFLTIAGNISPLVLVLAFLYPVSQLAKRIVEEKETRLREGMLIMGLGKMAFFSSWIFNYLLQVLLTTIIITIVLKLGILTQTDPTVIFCVYLFFCTSTITLSTLLSSFFSKSRITALVVPLLYFVLSIPSFALPDGTGRGIYVLLSLFSPTAFSLGTKLLFSYEINNGMGWNDVNSSLDEVNMAAVLFLLIFDTIFYLLLTLYFDEVLPSEWGTRSHPLFCLMPKCLCPPKAFDDGSHEGSPSGVGGAYGATREHPDSPKFAMTQGKGNREAVEDYPVTGKQPTVHLRRLRKEFGSDSGGAKKVAVDGFDLKLFEGQITVILGHNGAGKTTTLNMLTGMLPMTAGDCLVYGTSVRNDLRKARSEIGFCPQHNILWDQLTCMEHLRYIGRLKGVPSNKLEAAGLEMLRRVDLLDKKDVFSSSLSGGQKRKLSVAIAFMGGSRLILLDEPTAGMDASARRHTWDLLKEMSVGRTIVLTTHFMDEADLLGNRIAIMSKGALHSYGSSMFLKSKLGTGYAMRLSVNKIVDEVLANQLVSLVQQVIPSARLKEHKGQEVAITLPTHEQQHFARAIEIMETDDVARQYGVQGISMSVASLEDVFVRIAYEEEMLGSHEVEEEEVLIAASASSRQTSASNRNSRVSNGRMSEELLGDNAGQHQTAVVPVNKQDNQVPAPGTTATAVNNEPVHEDPEVAAAFAALDVFYAAMASKRANSNGSSDAGGFGAQFSGLLKKRFHNSKRDRRTMLLQVFLPLLCIVLAMLLAMLNGPSPSLLWVDNSMYGAPAQEILLTNCADLVPGINATQSFDGSAINYAVSPRATPAFNQSYTLSTEYLGEFFDHGAFERNIGFSCNDASMQNQLNNANIIFTNSSALHSFPEAVNELFASLARTQKADPSIIMRVGNYPLPLTNRQTTTIDSYRTAIIGFFILIPFTFIPSTFVSWVVKERECKAKHLQFVSGVNYFTYWSSNYVFDLFSYIITEVLAIIVFLIFGRDEYVDSTNMPVTIMIFLLYGISAIAASYCISFLFNNHSSAQTIVMLGNFLCGFVLVITMYILKQIDSTKDISKILVFIFRIVPAYCLGEGITALAMAPATRMLGMSVSVFELDQAGWGMIYMALEVVIFSVITLALDHPRRQLRRQQLFFDRNAVPAPIEGEDPDVTRERDVIERNADPTRTNTDIVRVCNLRKVYHTNSVDKVAVKNLSFGVQKGEVFGFLGTNGAGKTTTMSILTGEFLPSMGHASITGFDVVENAQDARQVIGYCPQFDALIDLITPEEHLRLYAALRGVPANVVDDVVEALLTACALQSYRAVRSKSLSGGNKRKLSVAISLIGGPRVVFLDEPSAGMDPHARRQLWDVILYIAQRSSVVLTTHHLEEVDVLAHRVGIMVDGALKCIGSLDYLKHRFGNGFEVAVKLKAAATDAQVTASARQVEQLLSSEFPGTAVVEERQQKVTFCVPFHGTKLSRVFQVLADAKNNSSQYAMDDYTVQQTSLEQVFLRISDEAAANEAAAAATLPSQPAVAGIVVSSKSVDNSNNNSAAVGNDSFSRVRQDSSAFYVPPQTSSASNRV